MTSVVIPPTNPSNGKSSHERVFDIILKEDELNWKELIYDLVRKENMDPWDINISHLAERFLVMLRDFKETDFRISGKMVLTSSLLLKIKSDRLLMDDLTALDNLIQGNVEDEFLEEGDGFEFEQHDLNQFLNDQKKIVPRSPQPRERKVSVFDLVEALEKALDTDAKRKFFLRRDRSEETVTIPVKSYDLSETMDILQSSLRKMFMKPKTKVFFNDLVSGDSKQDLVYTFLPLLHLENQRKVDLIQEDHFGPIEVSIHNKKL